MGLAPAPLALACALLAVPASTRWQGNPIAPWIGKKRKSGGRQKAQAA